LSRASKGVVATSVHVTTGILSARSTYVVRATCPAGTRNLLPAALLGDRIIFVIIKGEEEPRWCISREIELYKPIRDAHHSHAIRPILRLPPQQSRGGVRCQGRAARPNLRKTQCEGQ
jgi:hypothetical protein